MCTGQPSPESGGAFMSKFSHASCSSGEDGTEMVAGNNSRVNRKTTTTSKLLYVCYVTGHGIIAYI